MYNESIIKSFYVESRQHQNSALIATSDTLTPQWIIQTKDVTKINLSSVEYLIGSLCVSTYYKTFQGDSGRLVCQFLECLIVRLLDHRRG